MLLAATADLAIPLLEPLVDAVRPLLAVALKNITAKEADEENSATVDTPPPLETLFVRHADDVFRLIRRMLGPGASDADVEDLTQQVFIVAHRNIGTFEGRSKISTWLCGIATRTVLTHLRSRRRQKRLLTALESHAALIANKTDDPEQTVGDRMRLYQVWQCLMRIKPKKRVVFVLHEVEGLTLSEIATALAIPRPTVSSRLHHARKELLRALEKRGGLK